MQIAHLSPTDGELCGIALLARALRDRLGGIGMGGPIYRQPKSLRDGDFVVVHYHPERLGSSEIRAARKRIGSSGRLILFPHEVVGPEFAVGADGALALCDGLVPTGVPSLTFTHPCDASPPTPDRARLRAALGLPADRTIIATSGFLRFEREFDRVAEQLLDVVARTDGMICLWLSPWRLESPGLLDRLYTLENRHPRHLSVRFGHLSERALVARLGACDLLWCWTRASSRPYGSGVVSTHYASGARMVVTDKLQHSMVLDLPNVVRGSASPATFVDNLRREVLASDFPRHDPAPVSWAVAAKEVSGFLIKIARG